MMGAVGTGTVADGFLTMSMGTSGTLYGYSDKPIADPANGLSGFCSSTGGWLPLLCTMNCTVATEFVRGLFQMDVKELDGEAAKAPCGSEGVLVMPFFNGERTPNLPNGRASITGLTSANTNRANIARASLESAVFAMRGGLDAFRKLGFQPKEIRLIGGGSKSPLWRQIAADIMNLPIRVPALDEAAALGGAVQLCGVLKIRMVSVILQNFVQNTSSWTKARVLIQLQKMLLLTIRLMPNITRCLQRSARFTSRLAASPSIP